jgi:hypothetical protein
MVFTNVELHPPICLIAIDVNKPIIYILDVGRTTAHGCGSAW